mmetsp:Transcript_100232/g.283832  ORF Transcript_100232/g.283832 Transcript_100232/m.283832 type:complete len:293 (-) Transcript_100232:214-1092(-)
MPQLCHGSARCARLLQLEARRCVVGGYRIVFLIRWKGRLRVAASRLMAGCTTLGHSSCSCALPPSLPGAASSPGPACGWLSLLSLLAVELRLLQALLEEAEEVAVVYPAHAGERPRAPLRDQQALLYRVELLDALHLLAGPQGPPEEAVTLLVRQVLRELVHHGHLLLRRQAADALLGEDRELPQAPHEGPRDDGLVVGLEVLEVGGLYLLRLGLRLLGGALPRVDTLRHDHQVVRAERLPLLAVLAVLAVQVNNPSIALPAEDLTKLTIVLGSVVQAHNGHTASRKQLCAF